MRLIDADALIEFEERAWDGSAKEVSPSAVYNIILDDIRDAKTIDAIPVEWIEKWANRCIEKEKNNHFAYRGFGDYGISLLELVEEWRKER